MVLVFKQRLVKKLSFGSGNIGGTRWEVLSTLMKVVK
jgi:hypothetical protein